MNGTAYYRSRIVEVRAICWLGAENCEETFAFLGLEHNDDQHHDLIDINSYGHSQTIEAGDWVVQYADGNYQAFSDDEFQGEFEPADNDEPELGWDETAIHHPRVGMLRIPLNHDGDDAGVLVLDDDQAGKLAATILNMLADNKPDAFTWGEGLAADLDTSTINIPIEHGNVPIGNMRLPLKNAAVLRDMLDSAVAEAQQKAATDAR